MEQQKLIELIEESKQNNQMAFKQLVETYQYNVYRLALRLLCDVEDARDAVQETFIRVWKNLHRFDSNMKFSSWIYRITTNLCFDLLKSNKYRNQKHTLEIEKNEYVSILSQEDTEQTMTNKELLKIITSLTHQLTPKQKMVFTLCDLEGMGVNEMKQITGLSATRIKSNLYLARKFIRNKLNSIENK